MEKGSRLGAYDLVEELGAGGMGVVWRAHDRRLGRDVALKILPPHLAVHPEALVRFEREARGLAALSHPNIVSVFDLGQEDDVRYIVTELLDGETLRDRLRRGPLPWSKAAEICSTIADALAATHAKGIVHRDLKPENIFITDDGRVKILDFGLAKELAIAHADATTQVHQTEPGQVLGTLGYMAPEQLRGEGSGLASDIFSLGCVLYEMMSGRPAFLRNSSADTIAAILTTDPPPLGPMSDVPPELSRIVQRCLQKEPRARFQSAGDLSFALRDLSAPRRIEPHRTPRPERTPHALFIALAVAALAIGSYFAVAHRRSKVAPPLTPPESRAPMSIAVVPFAADAEHTYEGHGIAEALFRRLAPLRGVEVVSRKVEPQSFDARSLGTNHVLRGSVSQRNDSSLIVEAELFDVAHGRSAWSRSYDGTAAGLLGIEQRIGDDLETFLSSDRPDRTTTPRASTTTDPEAYREYLKGRYYWNKMTVDGFESGLAHFQKSIDLDPTYALAYAGLADAYAMLGFYKGHADEMMPKARAAAGRAIALDPNLGEAYTSLGTVLCLWDWKWSEAEAALHRGAELNPRYASAHHTWADYLGFVGRRDEALREIDIAADLDPLSLVIEIDRAWIHWIRGEKELALESIQRAIRYDPKSPLARGEYAAYLERLHRYPEALAAYEEMARLSGNGSDLVARMKAAYRSEGIAGYSRERLRMAEAIGESRTTRAALYIDTGDHQHALAELEAAYREHDMNLVYIKSSPTYAALRPYPRFQKLVAQIGFPAR